MLDMNQPESSVALIFYFTAAPTPEIYTLSLHDALPISPRSAAASRSAHRRCWISPRATGDIQQDRKSTRLNSSHVATSYAVFCLKKKRNTRRCEFLAR